MVVVGLGSGLVFVTWIGRWNRTLKKKRKRQRSFGLSGSKQFMTVFGGANQMVSHAGTRTRVCAVRGRYPDHLDYMGRDP
jgi:hypothetical protein